MSVRSKLHREDGAAAVEFALIVGLLAVLIFGLLEYGTRVLAGPEPAFRRP